MGVAIQGLQKISLNSLDRHLGEISIRTFSDGEIWVKYEENIRGCDVFIIQSTNGPSENIMELALLLMLLLEPQQIL